LDLHLPNPPIESAFHQAHLCLKRTISEDPAPNVEYLDLSSAYQTAIATNIQWCSYPEGSCPYITLEGMQLWVAPLQDRLEELSFLFHEFMTTTRSDTMSNSEKLDAILNTM
jgi:hypothetical protein